MTYEGSAGFSKTKTIEVDVGYGKRNSSTISIVVVDSDIQETSTIVPSQSGEAATGKTADENELDQFAVTASANPGGGSATFILRPFPSVTLTGKYKISYVIG